MTLLFISKAFAATANLVINPNLPDASGAATGGPTNWVIGFYNFALIVSGILAFGAIVYGGFMAATSAGNATRLSEGRSWIWSSLIGLLLLGGAYLILYTINPNLTQLQIGPVSSITPPAANPNAGGSNPPNGPVLCGGQINGQCPTAGQICNNQNGSYSCVGASSFDCGQPSTHFGSCPSPESCVNGASSVNAPPSYYCST